MNMSLGNGFDGGVLMKLGISQQALSLLLIEEAKQHSVRWYFFMAAQ